MCGRYTLHHATAQILARFEVTGQLFDPPARYNIAPTQWVSAIIANSPRTLTAMRWGLIPSWARDATMAARMINARAETVLEKRTFRTAMLRRRCLIPADGFYEWAATPGGKRPYHIRLRDGGLFAFAGLYDECLLPDGTDVQSCAIITVAANELVRPLHDRMPAILRREYEDAWLDTASVEPPEAAMLLGQYPPEEMEAYPVAARVGHASEDSSDMIDRVPA